MSNRIGIIGLGTMGTIVSRRLARQGFSLSVYNRIEEGEEEYAPDYVRAKYDELQSAEGFDSIGTFVNSLTSPRIIYLMVEAGGATDDVIRQLWNHVSAGDVIIDGGNAHYDDSSRRFWELHQQGILFLGCGISGGIDGAEIGLSIMAGGSREGYEKARPSLEALSARSGDGLPCCTYIGDEGAGHFVKMVHNGIEYAEMQLLAEVYSFLRWAVCFTPDVIADILSQWKDTDANGYLLEITLQILKQKDGDQWVIDSILDSAGHKGTGVWAVQAAASFGIPAMMITAALHARYLSARRHIRQQLDDISSTQFKKDLSVSTNDLYKAFQLSRLINYHEGFAIIRAASVHFRWDINLAELCRVWTNGCIIRSSLMHQFEAMWKDWDDELVLHPDIKSTIASAWPGLRRIVQVASTQTLFTPCLVAASQYISGASLRHPMANLTQAQRDYFGHHGYRKVGDNSQSLHHFQWNRET